MTTATLKRVTGANAGEALRRLKELCQQMDSYVQRSDKLFEKQMRNRYERIRLFCELMDNRQFIAAQYGDDEGRASDDLVKEYLADIGVDIMPPSKMRPMYRWHTEKMGRGEDWWKESRYNLIVAYGVYREEYKRENKRPPDTPTPEGRRPYKELERTAQQQELTIVHLAANAKFERRERERLEDVVKDKEKQISVMAAELESKQRMPFSPVELVRLVEKPLFALPPSSNGEAPALEHRQNGFVELVSPPAPETIEERLRARIDELERELATKEKYIVELETRLGYRSA